MAHLKIKIVGLGEGGARAITKMITAGVGTGKSVEFVAVGNDENVMLASAARKNIFLNRDLPTIYKNIADAFDGANLIFIVAGLGGSAARTAIPIITSCAKQIGAVTVAFVCRPFVLESLVRKMNAKQSLENLRGKVDTLFDMPAEKFFVFRINQPQVSLVELFDAANDTFCKGVKIFLDLLDEKNSSPALLKWGNAAFGYGEASDPMDAIKLALKFPTLDPDDLGKTSGIFVTLTGGKMLKLGAVESVNKFIKSRLQPDAEFFLRDNKNPALGEKVFASIILTRKGATS